MPSQARRTATGAPGADEPSATPSTKLSYATTLASAARSTSMISIVDVIDVIANLLKLNAFSRHLRAAEQCIRLSQHGNRSSKDSGDDLTR